MMRLSPQTPRVFRFGVFEVDPREGELRKSGLRIRLQDQPFQVLVMLLEHPGEIVTREELQRRLWPADTFVDFDHSLNSAIKKLREALQDQAENPRFVETVPKRGYRFIGTVSGDQRASNQTAEPAPQPVVRPLPKRLYAACALAALLVAGFLLWLYIRHVGEPRIRSLAVLFTNASNDPEKDYLVNGLSEEITNSLSSVSNLQVVPRSRVRGYKPQDDPQAVGRSLHVDAIVTGRVAEHGNELSVETELVDVGSGAQIWGKRYTRSADQALHLPSAIIVDILATLRPQRSGNKQASPAQVGTNNDEAYRLYLRGRSDFESWTPESLKAAADSFGRAVTTDPNYAAALAGLADVYAVQGYMGYVSGPELMERARSTARRAVELDAKIPEPHIALANLDLNYFWNFPKAEEEIQEALALDDKSAYAHEVSCWIKVSMGRSQEGLDDCRRAVELDPFSERSNLSLAFEYYWAHEYDHAIEQANKTLAMGPAYPQARLALALAYEQKGNYKQAISEWIEAERLSGHEAHAEEMKHIYDHSGYPGYLRQSAKDLKAANQSYYAAGQYAMLGDKDAAFAALEKIFVDRAGVRNMKVDPALDNLRSDPRFASLLRRIGLPS
jgi:DNA-binding winged helix-turn-helix (wHTH) protein/TolB-like protein/Tfp pilus assembly protein PilF